jgi:hypothetical protein
LEHLLVRNGQNCAQSFHVHILCSNIMLHRHDESPGVIQGARERPLRNSEQGILSLRRAHVYQVQDLALWLAHDGGMRRGYEITHAGRVPVVSPGQVASGIHTLLDDSPFSRLSDDETMQIELKAVRYCVVVNPRRQSARTCQGIAIEPSLLRERAQLIRCTNGVPAAAAANH